MEVHLARTVNVVRFPEAREQVLNGTFHRFKNPTTGEDFVVESRFLYTDQSRNTVILVKPRKERHHWIAACKELDQEIQYLPKTLFPEKGRYTRVVFGMGQLREKLIAQDADLDDRMVELYKVFLLHEHPFLLRRVQMSLLLEGVDDQKLDFVATFKHDSDAIKLELPRWVADDIEQDRDGMEKWAGNVLKNNMFAKELSLEEQKAPAEGLLPTLDASEIPSPAQLTDYHPLVQNLLTSPQQLVVNTYVSIERLNAGNGAIELLKTLAETARQGNTLVTDGPMMKCVIEHLPRGNNLPTDARTDLRAVYNYVKANGPASLEDTLFEIRFGIELDDDWSRNNDPDDIDTIWNLLRDLPDSNVEGNVAIDSIQLEPGKGGGSYKPSTRDISIGSWELDYREGFEDVLRHEVGHGVHEAHQNTINPWLTQEFGWQWFNNTNAGIDQWVNLMGGWGNLTNHQRNEVRQWLRNRLGRGHTWNPGWLPANVSANHPWRGANFGLRLAAEGSQAKWYDSNQDWYCINGRAFFLNYWYCMFMVSNTATLDFINNSMPDKYAAMSHLEFFAELYALYYDLNDPQRPNISNQVMQWLEQNVGRA